MKYYFRGGAEETWWEMRTVVRFGFRKVKDENPEGIVPHDEMIFIGPSYLEEIDTDKELLILGENVNIRQAPSLSADVIRTASYEVLACDCNILIQTDETYQVADGLEWVQVKLPSGGVGYVASKLTSSAIIKSMTVAKVEGDWKIISWFHAPGC